LRDSNLELKLDGGKPIPIGIKGTNTQCFSPTTTTGFTAPTATCQSNTVNPDTADNALWFQTNDGGGDNWGYNNRLWYYDPDNQGTAKTFATATVQQPLLVPVLQLHEPIAQPQGNQGGFPESDTLVGSGDRTRWLPRPEENTEYNLVLGAGDVPGRPGETNGGLQNLARFLENWGDPTQYTTKIFGSFVQSGRSEYATAPYFTLKADDRGQADGSIFGQETGYASNNAGKKIGYFQPPGRNWGFDVGLLAQPPDYFSRTFARLDKDQEGNYNIQQLFREVSKDDPWVKGLLCGKLADDDPVDPDDPDADIEDANENVVPDTIRQSLKCNQETTRTNKYDD
jgi:hypothetical protein